MRDVLRRGVVQAAALRARLPHPHTDSNGSVGHTPRIVVVRPDHLGDVLLTTPALAALRTALPAAHITALVGPWSAAVLANNPHVDEVATLRFPGFARDDSHAGVAAYTLLATAARRLRAERYDLAINLRPDFWWGAALLALAGIPQRVGFDVAPGRSALTDLVPAPGSDEHAALRSLRAVRLATQLLGADLALPDHPTPGDAPLVFVLTAADRAWADAWLRRSGLAPDRPPLVLHPGSGAAVKSWVPRKWAQVLAALTAADDAPLLITGAPGERPLVESVARLLPREVQVACCSEDVPLGRFAALLERGRLVLGTDSGPLHLAAAVGTPTVRLYGPTSAAVYGPWAPAGAHVALTSDIACAPCGRLDYAPSELPAHPCVRLITPGAVIAAARTVLRDAPAIRPAAAAPPPPECWPADSKESILAL